ncbi:hypothetical protein [Sphaerotilus mobilis]|uniref:Porin-like protein n=1 Tax=Sphaerotilus mobilis TaxID=47994 RepID=A0A4Q7LRJ6_9BURK|nr:hypothetical protein [Sphaerotilus mobilis]RZS56983.1 hypothetical protein EV685_1541 [Sphaerotilus mobilis]
MRCASRFRWALLAACLSGSLLSVQASEDAVEPVPPTLQTDNTAASPVWRINTFGTLAMARLNAAGLQLRQENTAPSGIGANWTGSYDSRLGVQISYEARPGLDLTLQPVWRRQTSTDRMGAEVDWAYVDWKPAPDWAFKVGRFGSPLFLGSEQRSLGLSQPWVRPPAEVYGQLGQVPSLDGVWLRRSLSQVDRTVQVDAYLARHRERRGDQAVEHHPIGGLRLQLLGTDWTWQAMAAQAHTRLRLSPQSPVLQALALLGAPAVGGDPVAALEYDVRDIRRLRFLSLGVRHDGRPWLLQAEVARISSDNRALPGSVGAYVTVGRQWQDWLLHLSWSGLRGIDPREESRFSGVAAQLVSDLQASQRRDGQHRLALGLRHDLQPGLALKAQIDRIRPRSTSPAGMFLEPQLPPGQRTVLLYSLAVDWAY